MKKWFLHILLLAGLFGVLTTSCSQEEGLEPQVSIEKVPVTFSIAMGNSSTRSRADEDKTWNDEYETSDIIDEFENEIDLNQLHVELTLTRLNEKNEEVITTVVMNPISCWKINNEEDLYQIVGEVNVNINSETTYEKAKVMVYANNNGKTEVFETQYAGALEGKGVNYIPMWGVKTIANFTLTPGSLSDFGSISLLRAMAKIEVTWEATSNFAKNGYTINSVGLNKYNTKGNLKPSYSGTEPENTTDYKINAINSLASPPDASGLLFFKASNNSYVIYIPEYENPEEEDSDDVVIWLDILDKNGNSISSSLNETHGSITMTDMDLVRNHWYKYIIKDVVIDTEVLFNLQYQVMEWTPINNGSLTFGGESGAIHTPKDEEEEED